MDKQICVAEAKKLIANYQPNAAARAQLANVELIATVGPTGVGKSAVMHRTHLPYILSDVTRAPRDGEHDGIDYNFRTDYAELLGEIQRGEFVQFVIERETEIYGTKLSSYPRAGACVTALIAISIPAFRTYGFKSVKPVFIVPPSYDAWLQRIGEHKDKDLEGRLLEAKESLTLALADPAYFFLVNDDLDTAVEQLKLIAAGTGSQQQSDIGKVTATQLLERLNRVFN